MKHNNQLAISPWLIPDTCEIFFMNGGRYRLRVGRKRNSTEMEFTCCLPFSKKPSPEKVNKLGKGIATLANSQQSTLQRHFAL